MCSNRKQIRIASDDKPIEIVKSSFPFFISIKKYDVGINDLLFNFDEMIQKADKGLYDAKNNGRSRVRYR